MRLVTLAVSCDSLEKAKIFCTEGGLRLCMQLECALNVLVGCGRGVVCSTHVSSAWAYCDQCDFDNSRMHCSSYIHRDMSPSNETDCLQGPTVVYTGTSLELTGSYVITLLVFCIVINVKKLHFIHMLTATDDRSSHIKNSKNKKVILL